MFFLTPIFFLSQDRVSFDQWFLVKPLQDYINVVTMEVFMKNIASRVWPPGKRIGLFSHFWLFLFIYAGVGEPWVVRHKLRL